MRHAKEFLLLPQSSLRIRRFFSLTLRFQSSGVLAHCPRSRVGFGPKFCGTDGKPTSRIERLRHVVIAMRRPLPVHILKKIRKMILVRTSRFELGTSCAQGRRTRILPNAAECGEHLETKQLANLDLLSTRIPQRSFGEQHSSVRKLAPVNFLELAHLIF
jgi:hypothetical protein